MPITFIGNGHASRHAVFTKITVKQAEGLSDALQSGTFAGPGAEDNANRLLRSIASQVPSGMLGYFKVDVTSEIHWGNQSTTYRSRHDVKRNDPDGDVRGHIVRFLGYVVENQARLKLSSEEIRESKTLLEALGGQTRFPRVQEVRREAQNRSGPLGLGVVPAARHLLEAPKKAPAPALERNATMKRIREALQERSGKAWSVTGGRGTAYGWIRIKSPPRRSVGDFGYMSQADREELQRLLGLKNAVHQQGVNIPSSSAYYAEYLDRAEGRPPTRIGTPYWD